MLVWLVKKLCRAPVQFNVALMSPHIGADLISRAAALAAEARYHTVLRPASSLQAGTHQGLHSAKASLHLNPFVHAIVQASISAYLRMLALIGAACSYLV